MSVALICDFAVQIADAMAYLENRRIVHRNLAARNILMFAKDKVCQWASANIHTVQVEYIKYSSGMNVHNTVVTREIKLFQNYFNLRRHLSEIILPKIISEAYCSSWMFSSVFNVAEVILK